MEKAAIDVYTDGGSRGNPGPAACAFVVMNAGRIIASGSKFLGTVTNNVAEYNGVILALAWLMANSELTNKDIVFHLDSELVVKQLTGLYKVKEEHLKELVASVKNMIANISLDKNSDF